MSLFAELKRRSVFKVGTAYLIVAWLLIQVAATVAPQLGLPEWAPRLITLILLIGFPVALVMAWAFERAPEGLKLDPAPFGNKRMIAVALVLAVLAIVWYFAGQPTDRNDLANRAATGSDAQSAVGARATAVPAQRSIAVLPFVNMSGEAENEYFSDGLSEEILNSLARIEGMQVAGRTSSFQFKGKSEDLRQVGEKLGVANVLEGSVRRSGDRARITAQLIRVSDGFHLWSQTYDRTLTDTLAMQLDIAENVAGVLDVVMDETQRERMRDSGVKNVDAFIAFQKARKLYSDAHDPARSDNLIATLRLAGVEFAKATALEPDFATAYYLSTDLYSHIVMSDDATETERDAAMTAARRNLDLALRSTRDPEERQIIEVERQLISDDWRGLADRFEAAVADQGYRYGNWLLVSAAFGFADARLASVRERILRDPLSSLGYQNGTQSANWAGRPEQTLEFVAEANRAMGGAAQLTQEEIRALVTLGRIDEARAQVATLDADSVAAAVGELLVGAALGEDVTMINERSRRTRQRGWNPEYWTIVDGLAEALAGDRAAGNRRAASIDAVPGGPLKLAVLVTLCQCGVPFDLDATPNFKARLEESGLPWPPPDLIAGLRRGSSGAQ